VNGVRPARDSREVHQLSGHVPVDAPYSQAALTPRSLRAIIAGCIPVTILEIVNRSMTRARLVAVLWWLLPFAVLVLSALVQVSHGVYFHMFTHDMFVPLEGALHLQHGHLPHRDFVSPLGILYYVIHYLPGLVVPVSASTLVYANLLAALPIALVALIVGRQRLPLWLASVVALYLGLVASSPRQIGEAATAISNNASYNRFGWALIGLLALVAACPRPDPARRSSLVDGAVVGALLTALFLIKLTYAGAALGIVLVTLVTVRRLTDWRFPATLFGLFVAIVLLVELGTGLIHLYLADVRMAASVATDVLRPAFAMRLLSYCATGAVAVLVIGLLNEPGQRRYRVWVPRTLLSLAIVLAGVAIGIQNHPELENPLLAIAVLVAGYPALRLMRRPAADAADGAIGPRTGRLCATGFVAMAAVSMVQDVAAIGWTAMAPRARGAEVAWLAGTPIADLALSGANLPSGPLGTDPAVRNDVALMGVIGDGVALLRPHVRGRRDAVVLPLTFSNPFPLILGLPPVRHEVAWWHAGRTFSQETRPEPDLLLGGVDYVLMPKRYMSYSTVLAFRAAYAPEIARDFRLVDENGSWQLLARRDCQARALC
jgi:hypothetical protein